VLLQFAGEVIARGLGIPLPGPVVGLILLFGGLVLRGRTGAPAVDPALRSTAQGLLSNLSLLFVPAGVGVITQLDVLGANLLPIAVSILVSTVLGLLVTGWLMQRLSGPEE
jgi:holin-like protein